MMHVLYVPLAVIGGVVVLVVLGMMLGHAVDRLRAWRERRRSTFRVMR
jgi:MFS superfamily sulfate permease-like transporter